MANRWMLDHYAKYGWEARRTLGPHWSLTTGSGQECFNIALTDVRQYGGYIDLTCRVPDCELCSGIVNAVMTAGYFGAFNHG